MIYIYDIREVKRAAPLREVIERHTNQQSRGRFRCPFHNDRHPSLTIKGDHWQCWSCGKGGDVINFIRELYGVTTGEAIRILAEEYGLKEPEPDGWRDAAREARENISREVKRIREEKRVEYIQLAAYHRTLYARGNEEEAAKIGEELDKLGQYL